MKKINIFFPAIFIFALMSGCFKEDPMKKPYTDFNPVDISDGWVLSNPSAENIDSLALDGVYRDVNADDNLWMTKSMLVFRNGKLVAESYLKDDIDRTRIDALWSCTKQVNSIITGIAINQGFIRSVTDSVSRYLPEYIAKHLDKASLTLENLLIMGSGVAFHNITQSDVFRKHLTDNSIDYVLGLQLNFEPGTGYNYNDGDPQVVSGLVQAATGKPMDEYGKDVLFDKPGITNYEWVRYSDGVTMGGFGILTCPRELAKIGQCVLDTGRHNGQQIIPLTYWQEMLSGKVIDAGGDRSFGYFWWSAPSKGYWFMWGHGSQHAFLIPEKRLMVVITSLTQVDDDENVPVEYLIDIVDRIVLTAK
jgi:CubicO group peptidase (beta-lactamase class C family)